MGTLTERIGIGIYNSYVERRNKFVSGEYHVKNKATKAANYLHSVGKNIMEDVQAGQPQDAFPFKIPKNNTISGQHQKTKKTIHHHHHYYHEERKPKHRKHRDNHGSSNPYSLI